MCRPRRSSSRPLRLVATALSVLLAGLTALPPSVLAAERRIRFFHPDHLGSTNIVTDEAGQVVEVIEYKPFGEVYRRTGPATARHTFTGQRPDDSTGLYFYHARYYDPQLGRFIQPDPIVQDPTDPQTLNRYAYVRNNPLKYTDPSGRIFGFDDLFAFILFAIFVVVVGVGSEAYARQQEREFFREAQSPPASRPPLVTAASIQSLKPFVPPSFLPLRQIADSAQQVGEDIAETLSREAIRNLALVGVAPTAAFLTAALQTPENLAGMAVVAGEVVSAFPEGSGSIARSLALNTLSDPSMPTARWRVKIAQDLKVRLGSVKRVWNNRFLVPGSRAFGTPAKSFAAPVFKGIGRAFGVASLAGHVNEFASQPLSIMSFRSGALIVSDIAGLISGVSPITAPLRLVPALAGAVDLFSQKAMQSWYGLPDE